MWPKYAFLGSGEAHAAVVLLSIFVQAQNEQAAVYISDLGQSDDRYNLTFAVNTHDAEPDDLWFYLSGPSRQWIGVGLGSRMEGALMLVVYPDKDRKNVKLSPRIATGHSEPTYIDSIKYELKDTSRVSDDVMVARGICHNCGKWNGGSVDFSSTKSPFIYAVGPMNGGSDALDADLQRHTQYGHFTMNLAAARGDPAGFPTDLSKSDNATADGGVTNDKNYSSNAHGFVMACVFVVIFPFGASYLRLQDSVRWHWITQAIGVIGAIIGVGIALNLSHMYNRSKHFNSGHQLIGLCIFALLLVQATLGSVHHWKLFKKASGPSIFSNIHRNLGPLLIVLGIINGGIGLSFASASRSRIVGYSLLTSAVALTIVALFLWKTRRDRRKAPRETVAARNFQSAYLPPQYQNDIPLRSAGTPPPYSPSRPLYP